MAPERGMTEGCPSRQHCACCPMAYCSARLTNPGKHVCFVDNIAVSARDANAGLCGLLPGPLRMSLHLQ